MSGSRMMIWVSLIVAVLSQEAGAVTKISSVDFKAAESESVIEVNADGPLSFKQQDNAGDGQVVFEISDASFAKGVDRKLDTSSFANSRVTLVSPYAVEGQPGTVRVAIQMKDFAAVSAAADGNRLLIRVPAANGKEAGGDIDPPPGSTAIGDSIATSEPPAVPVADASPLSSDAGAGKLTEFVNSQAAKQFKGKNITLQVREAEIADVLRMIGDASGFNIIVADNVQGKINLSLVEVPWDQALDVVLHTKQLGAERNGNILRVMTLQSLVQEKQAELDAKRAAEASAPRITRVLPISYAKISELQPVLEKFRGGAQQAAGPGASEVAVIQADERTNQIIVRDIPENVDKLQKLVELLDTQTPQVMIEAKIIEASEEFSRTLNGSLGFGPDVASGVASTLVAGSFNGLDPTVGFFSGGGVTGSTFSSGAAGGSNFGFSTQLSFLPGVQRLNALLGLGENERDLKVLSAPKTVVLNREQATITAGTPVTIRTQQTVAGVGVTSVESVVQANLSLQVRPTVTNDGSVLMELQIQRDLPFGTGIANRSMNTRVLVESGNTLVIGGIYSTRTEKQSSGIPFLRKIPIIGAFFGSEVDKTERSELFIFVTPRIINEREAGLSG